MNARQGWLTFGLVVAGVLLLVSSIWTAGPSLAGRRPRAGRAPGPIAKKSDHRGPVFFGKHMFAGDRGE